VETKGGERVEVVRGGRSSTVMGSVAAHVLGDERAVVDGDAFQSVNASAERVVTHDLTTRVGGVDERRVQGAQRVTVAGDQSTRVEGCAMLQVGRGDHPGTYAVHVEGYAQLAGTTVASLSSDREVLLRCGRSSIRITPDQIELVSPTVLLTAEGAAAALGGDRVRFRAAGRATVVADSVTLRTAGASLGLDSEARLGGAKVRLGVRDDSDDLSPAESPTPTRIELVDQDGAPLAYQRFTLVLPDGSTRAGVLDRDGAAVVDLDGPAEIVFDELPEVREA